MDVLKDELFYCTACNKSLTKEQRQSIQLAFAHLIEEIHRAHGSIPIFVSVSNPDGVTVSAQIEAEPTVDFLKSLPANIKISA
jgi:hypothetical protein